MKPWTITFTLLCIFGLCAEGFAQNPKPADLSALKAEIDSLKADYEKRIQALENQLQQLQGQAGQPANPAAAAAPQQAAQTAEQPAAQVPPGAEGAGGPSGALPVYGSAVGGRRRCSTPISPSSETFSAPLGRKTECIWRH